MLGGCVGEAPSTENPSTGLVAVIGLIDPAGPQFCGCVENFIIPFGLFICGSTYLPT